MAKITKTEEVLFDLTGIKSDSMESAPIEQDALPVTESAPIDAEWIIETNHRGEVVNCYPKARDAGK